jgi:hypothetical protein
MSLFYFLPHAILCGLIVYASNRITARNIYTRYIVTVFTGAISFSLLPGSELRMISSMTIVIVFLVLAFEFQRELEEIDYRIYRIVKTNRRIQMVYKLLLMTFATLSFANYVFQADGELGRISSLLISIGLFSIVAISSTWRMLISNLRLHPSKKRADKRLPFFIVGAVYTVFAIYCTIDGSFTAALILAVLAIILFFGPSILKWYLEQYGLIFNPRLNIEE